MRLNPSDFPQSKWGKVLKRFRRASGSSLARRTPLADWKNAGATATILFCSCAVSFGFLEKSEQKPKAAGLIPELVIDEKPATPQTPPPVVEPPKPVAPQPAPVTPPPTPAPTPAPVLKDAPKPQPQVVEPLKPV
ncbi:MAG: hypothetical protein WCL08_14490, partial [Verrucomicrobiota bacterium]